MKRRKRQPETLLTRLVSVRFSEQDYRKLLVLVERTNVQSIGALIRRIILKEKILLYLRDSTMDGVDNELAGIRTELKAIGININQITHAFHVADTPAQKVLHASEVAAQYHKVGEKVNLLLALIADLPDKQHHLPPDRKLKAAFLLRDLIASASIT